MGLFLLVPGLILLLAGGGWFENADTVGAILTAVGGVLILLQGIVGAFILRKASKEFRRF